jgi:four helix bundle protein
MAMELVEVTYRVTRDFPDTERYALVSQIRRAAMSIPSTVAEGQGVRTPRWSLRHIVIAIGSSWELDTQAEAAVRLRFVTADEVHDLRQLLERVQKLLYGLRREKERRLAIPFVTTAWLLTTVLLQVVT